MSNSLISLGLGFGVGKASTSNGRISGGAIDGVLLTEASEFLMTEDDNNLALDDLSTFNEYSVDYDGTNDLMSLGTTLDFNFDSSDTFTISQWVKFDTLGTLNRIFFRHNGATAGYNFYYQNGVGWRLYTNTGYTLSSASVSTGQWYHVVLVYDAQNVTLYVDNTSLGTTSSVPISSAGAITASVSSSSFPTNGNIDEVSLYTSALGSSDVSTIYNSGTPGDVSSLSPFGWWRKGDSDSGSGTIITDLGSGGNNGTLLNGAVIVEDTP
jgi:hypothetical protein